MIVAGSSIFCVGQSGSELHSSDWGRLEWSLQPQETAGRQSSRRMTPAFGPLRNPATGIDWFSVQCAEVPFWFEFLLAVYAEPSSAGLEYQLRGRFVTERQLVFSCQTHSPP